MTLRDFLTTFCAPREVIIVDVDERDIDFDYTAIDRWYAEDIFENKDEDESVEEQLNTNVEMIWSSLEGLTIHLERKGNKENY